jgi:hypothetical protein
MTSVLRDRLGNELRRAIGDLLQSAMKGGAVSRAQ